MSTPSITLYQYSPSNIWENLPTFDPLCLKIHTFLKFSGIPFNVIQCRNPNESPNGILPFIKIDNDISIPEKDIFSYFKSNDSFRFIDDNFSSDEIILSNIHSFSSMANDTLYNLQLFNWWIDKGNYESVIHQSYSRSINFPYNWILPRRMKQNIEKKLELLNIKDENIVYQEFEDIYSVLSKKLGKKKFFFGDKPSSFDCIAFGLLTTQYYAPFKNNRLRYLISPYKNLKEYIKRILFDYFNIEMVKTLNESPLESWIKKNKGINNNITQDQQLKDDDDNNTSSNSSSNIVKKYNYLSIAISLFSFAVVLFTMNKQSIALLKYFNKRRKGNLKESSNISNPYKTFIHKDYEGEEEEYFYDDIEEKDWDEVTTEFNENDHFFNEDKEPIIEDDGSAYDWDEKYLEELQTGDIPDDSIELDYFDDE